MANFEFDMERDSASIIKVIGVGGGGSNAVNNMFRHGIKGVDFVVCNTDAQALQMSEIPNKLLLGPELTAGRGAGSIPDKGKMATEQSIQDIHDMLNDDTKMIFIAAGMGGGTGTGGAPVIAKEARERGILTVAIVTIPFSFEGKKRMRQAEEGIRNLREHVDSIIVISNDKLRELYGSLKISEAFNHADEVLRSAAKGIAEIITVPGYINVDFEDVKTVMTGSGIAVMGTGVASGEDRARRAVMDALECPLLDDNNIRGAKHILLQISAGSQDDVTMEEIGEITDFIQDETGLETDTIWGNSTDDSLSEALSVTIIATGFSNSEINISALRNAGINVNQKSQQQQAPRQQQTAAPNATPLFPDSHQHSKQQEEPFIKGQQKGESNQPQNSDEIYMRSNKADNFEEDVDYTSKRESKQPVDGPSHFENFPVQPNQSIDPNDRIKTLREMSSRMASKKYVEDLENVPAYMRKKVELEDVPNPEDQNISRLKIDEDPNSNSGLSTGNSFLHDNVD